jgi:integral membrane sensor domain MASE1
VPGRFWINLRTTALWRQFSLPTLAYHEAIPGHVWQGEYTFRLPLIRMLLAFNAYSEGWALYSEQLADELGAYENDPVGRLGYLHSISFRACRLVVDTGLHAKRWTRAQAIDWFVRTNGSNREEVEGEVDRYCAWPGQACGYKVGHSEIKRLRAKAQAALGERFDPAPVRRCAGAGRQCAAHGAGTRDRSAYCCGSRSELRQGSVVFCRDNPDSLWRPRPLYSAARADETEPVPAKPALHHFLLLFVLYAATGLFSRFVFGGPDNLSDFWLPTGIAMGALLSWNTRLWPAVLAGALFVIATASVPLPRLLLSTAASVLTPLLGARLVERYAGGERMLDSVRDVVRFVLLGPGVAAMAGATLATLGRLLSGAHTWPEAPGLWLVWWQSDAIGALVGTPAFLLISTAWSRRRTFARVVGALVLLGLTAASCYIPFGPDAGANTRFKFLLIPLVLWAAVRFGTREVALQMVVIALFAAAATARGDMSMLEAQASSRCSRSAACCSRWRWPSAIARRASCAIRRRSIARWPRQPRTGSWRSIAAD